MSKKQRNAKLREAEVKNNNVTKHLSKKIYKVKKKNKTNKRNVVESTYAKVGNISSSKVRNVESWKCKTYNEDNQVLSLARHLYCLYIVPLFILRDVFINKNYSYVNMVITIGQGGSFYKNFKHLFTKKEAHVFLNLKTDVNISTAILLAKFIAADIAEKIFNNLLHRPMPMGRVGELINFIKRYHDDYLTGNYDETYDFIIHQFNTDDNFTLSKRTLNSVTELSNAWHEELQSAKQLKELVSWERIFQDYHYVNEDQFIDVTFKEILDSNELYKEGRAQRHCVGSYINSCKNNLSRIYKVYNNNNSLFCRMTIEIAVSTKKVTQIRKRFNASPSKDELKIVQFWANANNLSYDYKNFINNY